MIVNNKGKKWSVHAKKEIAESTVLRRFDRDYQAIEKLN